MQQYIYIKKIVEEEQNLDGYLSLLRIVGCFACLEKF